MNYGSQGSIGSHTAIGCVSKVHMYTLGFKMMLVRIIFVLFRILYLHNEQYKRLHSECTRLRYLLLCAIFVLHSPLIVSFISSSILF